MVYLNRTADAVLSHTRAAASGDASAQRRKRHAEQVVKHIVSAKAGESGRDITDFSEEEIIADLRAHQRVA